MKKDMLGAIVRRLVGLPDEKLGTFYDFLEKEGKLFENGEWNNEFKKFLRKEKCWINTVLKFNGTVNISMTPGSFIAENKFIVDVNNKEKVKIFSIGKYFQKNFLKKIENPVDEVTLNYRSLLKNLYCGDFG